MYRLFEEAQQQHEKHLPYPQPWEFVYENFFYGIKNNFFVDVGASNGLNGSNSSLFEFYLNWNGICIEPNKVQYEQLIKNRKCKTYNCCIGNTNSIKEFWEIQGDVSALSGLKETYDYRHIQRVENEVSNFNDKIVKKQVEVKTLDSIISENNIDTIDYLSIDVEGAELQVLEGINFNKCNIKVISVEDNGYTDEPKNYLLNKNYRYITKICSDMIFVK